MFVRTLYCPDGAIAGPTWPQIEQAIRRLATPAESVVLSAHPDGRMAIFRLHPPDGYLVVGPQDAYLKDPATGRPTDRAPLDAALRAARCFFETGQLDQTLGWYEPAA